MKAIFVLSIAFLFFHGAARALPPEDAASTVAAAKMMDTDFSAFFDANGLLVFVSNRGSVGEDFDRILGQGNPGFYYPYNGSCGDITGGTLTKTVLFCSGLMLGGKVNGAIRTAVSGFGQQEFSPGPADPDGLALPDIPRFKVYKIDHDSAVWLDPSKPPCAAEDSTHHFNDWQLWKDEAILDGAPLDNFDNPLLLGQQTLWAVYNDGGTHDNYGYAGGTEPLGVEVHQTVWGSGAPGEENVIYLKYKLYNRGHNVIDSFYFSYWADPDIGGSTDDMVGCDSVNMLFFALNGMPTDTIYGDVPAAWGGKVLFGPVVPEPESTAIFDGHPMPGYRNVGMSSFNKFINGTDPDVPSQLFDYMKGLDAVETGGPYYDPDGNLTKFPYAGNPVTGEGWIDGSPSDKRLMANFGPFTFQPGDSQQVVFRLAAYAEENRLYSFSKLRHLLDENIPIEPVIYSACQSAEVWKGDYGRLKDIYFEPLSERWLTGVNWGGHFFYNSSDYGINFWGGYLDPETMIDSFCTVEVRFSDAPGQRAYRYIRPGYAYGGYEWVPFTVWDTESNRQLNAAFVEWTGSNVFDNTWGPDGSDYGGREYLLVLKSDYDGDDPGDAGSGALDYPNMDFADGSAFDILYAGWFRVRPGHDLSELDDGQMMVFEIAQRLNPNGPVDSLLFADVPVGRTDIQQVEIRVEAERLAGVRFVLTGSPAFSIDYPMLEFYGTSMKLANITYAPQSEDRHVGYLTLFDKATGIPRYQVKLIAGTACGEASLKPSPMYAFFTQAIDTLKATLLLPGSLDGQPVFNIDTASLLINGSIKPLACYHLENVYDCDQVLKVEFDAARFVEQYMTLWDTTRHEYTLAGRFLDQTPFVFTDSVIMIGHRSGDVNNDGLVDIRDVGYLVQFLYAGGKAPVIEGAGDVNASGSVNIRDIAYLINFLYRGGPEPHCK